MKYSTLGIYSSFISKFILVIILNRFDPIQKESETHKNTESQKQTAKAKSTSHYGR